MDVDRWHSARPRKQTSARKRGLTPILTRRHALSKLRIDYVCRACMNLWLRLIGLLLFRDRRRVDVLATTRVSFRAWPTDLDLNGHVNNGRYLMFADLARIDWFLRTGVMQTALRQRARPVVGDAMAKFRRDLRLFQSFEIHSRLLGWDERWGFLEHRFVRGG